MIIGILFVDVLGNAKYATILKSNEINSLVIYDINEKKLLVPLLELPVIK